MRRSYSTVTIQSETFCSLVQLLQDCKAKFKPRGISAEALEPGRVISSRWLFSLLIAISSIPVGNIIHR
jgi:hypothetical protein